MLNSIDENRFCELLAKNIHICYYGWRDDEKYYNKKVIENGKDLCFNIIDRLFKKIYEVKSYSDLPKKEYFKIINTWYKLNKRKEFNELCRIYLAIRCIENQINKLTKETYYWGNIKRPLFYKLRDKYGYNFVIFNNKHLKK